jgi:hypothetical protein
LPGRRAAVTGKPSRPEYNPLPFHPTDARRRPT